MYISHSTNHAQKKSFLDSIVANRALVVQYKITPFLQLLRRIKIFLSPQLDFFFYLALTYPTLE